MRILRWKIEEKKGEKGGIGREGGESGWGGECGGMVKWEEWCRFRKEEEKEREYNIVIREFVCG